MNQNDAYKLLHDGSLALARAERQGIRIDTEYCQKKKQHLERKISRLETKFKGSKFFKHWQHSTHNKVNIHSTAQLGNFLYKVKKLEPPYTTATGKGSADEEALQMLNIPELNQLLQIRKLLKIKDTYLEAFTREQVDGYIHPSFNLHLVRTFRSSANSPNFQNIPKRDKEAMQTIRRGMFPRLGHQLMEVDFSGMEFNINACYSQDPVMIDYCKNPESDPHGDIAQKAFLLDEFDKTKPDHKTLRAAAKNGFVFPVLYGSYYKNCAINLACQWGGLPEKGKWKKGMGIGLNGGHLSDHLIANGIRNLDDFTNHMREIENEFFNTFAVHKKYMETTFDKYRKNGYIEMHTGFRCKGIMTRNNVLNYPVQGAAFHCLLWCFIRLDKIIQKKKWRTRLIGQIHDAIVLDVYPDELQEVAQTVRLVLTGDLPQNWTWINVPLRVDADLGEVDESWADLKPYELPK